MDFSTRMIKSFFTAAWCQRDRTEGSTCDSVRDDAFSADDLRFAVLSEDAKTIAKAPGIGVKTAKKMILELKDKLDLEDAFEKKLLHEQEAEETLPDARGEAVEALTALGYSPADALRAVQKVEPGDDMDTEAILKAALKRMI